jgi:hypothetical protein
MNLTSFGNSPRDQCDKHFLTRILNDLSTVSVMFGRTQNTFDFELSLLVHLYATVIKVTSTFPKHTKWEAIDGTSRVRNNSGKFSNTFSDKFSNKFPNLQIYHQNIRGLSNKIDELLSQ